MFRLLVLFGIALASSQLSVAEEICEEGFIMDKFCIDNKVLFDKNHLQTLDFPEEHSIHCLIDLPQCRADGYQLLKPNPGGETKYINKYKFDEEGNKKIIAYGEKLRSTVKGLKAVIIGKIIDNAKPPTLKITLIKAAGSGCPKKEMETSMTTMMLKPSTSMMMMKPSTSMMMMKPSTSMMMMKPSESMMMMKPSESMMMMKPSESMMMMKPSESMMMMKPSESMMMIKPSKSMIMQPTTSMMVHKPKTTMMTTMMMHEEEICEEGFIMDKFCIDNKVLFDKNHLQTLDFPEEHSIHCLIDLPQCRADGYQLLKPNPGGKTKYINKYKFDEEGNKKIIAYGEELRSTVKGLKAVIIGKIIDNAQPPTLKITLIKAAGSGCPKKVTAAPKTTEFMKTTEKMTTKLMKTTEEMMTTKLMKTTEKMMTTKLMKTTDKMTTKMPPKGNNNNQDAGSSGFLHKSDSTLVIGLFLMIVGVFLAK